MPALPNVPQVVKIAVKGQVGIYNWVNVFHAKYTGAAPSVSTCETFADNIGASWAAYITGLQDTSTVMSEVTVTDLTSPESASGVAAATNTGSRSGDFLPASACFLTNYPISLRYRGGHPRTYWSIGVWSDLLDPSHWTGGDGGFVSIASGAIANFLNGIWGMTAGATVLAQMGAVSYNTAGARRGTPVWLPYASASAFNAQAELASQRRQIGRK